MADTLQAASPTRSALRSKTLWLCLLAALLLAWTLHAYALPHRTLTMARAADSPEPFPVRLPVFIGLHEAKGNDFLYRLDLQYDNWPYQQTGFQLISNGCLVHMLVNGVNVPMRQENRCNPAAFSYWSPYSTPLYLELGRLLKPGANTILIQSTKGEFDMGPVVFYNNFAPAKWIALLMLLFLSLALYDVMARHTGDSFGAFILVAGFLVHVQRLTRFGAMQYAMDMPGHLAYIANIARDWELPNPYSGWSYYHPPLYYALQAAVLRFANWLASFDPLVLMQCVSLFCFTLFMLFSAFCLRRIIRARLAYYAALALLVFYPSGIMFSSHIDSHLLFYPLYAAALYYTLRWLDTARHGYFAAAVALTGLAVATRSNALILLPILGLAFFYNLGRGRASLALLWRSDALRLGLLVLCLGLLANLGRIEWYRMTESHHDPLLVGNISKLSVGLRMHNDSLIEALTPRLGHYFTHPFWSVWDNGWGRQYFWNSLLKSSLTGEFNWDWQKRTAWIMGALLLAIIVYIADAYRLHRRDLRKMQEWHWCFWTLLIAVAALFYNRWIHPYGCSEDFRYIYPSIASFCGLAGLAIERHRADWRPFRTWLGVLLCALFAYASVRFYTA